MALIDSKMWADGNYWWDNKALYRSGTRMEPFKLGAAVNSVRRAYPGCIVEGWVVIHSRSGKLHHPRVERAGMISPMDKAAVYLVNASELPSSIHRFLTHGGGARIVDVPVLANLLRSML